METSIEVPQKIKNKATIESSNFTSGCYPNNIYLKKIIQIYSRENKNSNFKRDTCIQIFITALFTRAKVWKQPECPSVNEWMKTIIVCIYVYETGKRSPKM